MLTAKDAAQIVGERNVDLEHILGLIKESAEEGEWSLVLEQDDLDEDKENMLRSLGYTIEWNRALLQYTVGWSRDFAKWERDQ